MRGCGNRLGPLGRQPRLEGKARRLAGGPPKHAVADERGDALLRASDQLAGGSLAMRPGPLLRVEHVLVWALAELDAQIVCEARAGRLS